MASGEGARLTMKMDEGNLRQYLMEMEGRGMDLRVYWKRLGSYMAYKSVEKTFKKQGRPKWDKLSDYTMALRDWRADPDSKASPKRAKTDKILEVTGGLRGSFTFRARPKRLDVGTAVPHAANHQFGKWVAAPARWERPMVKIPKRQLVGIHPEDEKVAIKFAVRDLEKG